MACWIANLTNQKQKVLEKHSTMGRRQDTAEISTRGIKRLPFTEGTDITNIRLAHQSAGKPAAGAGGNHIGSYSTSPKIKRIGKETACQCRRHKRLGFDPWVGKIPWRRKWQPTPVFLHGESHGQRSLAGYSP